jgi:hypothetical protein
MNQPDLSKLTPQQLAEYVLKLQADAEEHAENVGQWRLVALGVAVVVALPLYIGLTAKVVQLMLR